MSCVIFPDGHMAWFPTHAQAKAFLEGLPAQMQIGARVE
jgi:hypothetical protein